MTKSIMAIYEHGILRPVVPLDLPDQTEVEILLHPTEPAEPPQQTTQGHQAGYLYDELIELIALGSTPQAIIDFRPSEQLKERVADLIFREKSAALSAEETAELNHYLQLEHLIRLAKAKARSHLAQTPPD